jgi:hypothetical protein
MMVQTKRSPGAQQGNKNRQLAEDERKRGTNTNLSMDYETWEAFKSAADLYEGHVLSEIEYKKLWRRLCSGAIIDFIKQHQGNIDPEIMVY